MAKNMFISIDVKNTCFFSAFVVDNVLDQWTQIVESIDIPRVMFSGSCADKDVSYIFNIIDDFPDPGWKNPVSIKSKNIQLDSKVIHVSATANKYDSGTHTFSEDCQPDSKLLYSHKVVARLYTKVNIHDLTELELNLLFTTHPLPH